MAFGFASKPTRKWSYDAAKLGTKERDAAGRRIPFHGHDAAVEQLFKAHRYQCALAEIERTRRKNADVLIHKEAPDLQVLLEAAEKAQKELDDARKLVGDANSKSRRKNAEPTKTTLAKDLKKIAAMAWAAYKTRKSAVYKDPDILKLLQAVEDDAAAARKKARDDAVAGGLYWATAAHVGTRVKNSGPPPRDPRWDGTGLLGVQIQKQPVKGSDRVPVLMANGQPRLNRGGKPMTRPVSSKHFGIANVLAGETNLVRMERRRDSDGKPWGKQWLFKIRVASNDDGSPVWATVPIYYHRDVPPDAEVKWAYLIRRRIGTQFRWKIQLDLARDSWTADTGRATEGTVAVALGWRKIGDAIRVAVWEGTDGKTGEVWIPQERVDGWGVCDSLRSTRDLNFLREKEILVNFLKGRELNDDWKTQTASIELWKSPRRLYRFVLWWRNNRIEGDSDAFRQLEGERYFDEGRQKNRYTGGRLQDKHLLDWECYDKKTEVLTVGGWMYFDKLKGNEELATVNLKTDLIEYQKPIRLIRRTYSGDMVKIGGNENQRVDLLVTPGHRMVIYKGQNSKGPEVCEAKDLTVDDKIKTRAKWEGISRDKVHIPAVGKFPAVDVNAHDLARFLGWYVSEGWCNKRAKKTRIGSDTVAHRVGICQKPGWKRERIRSVLDRLPWRYCEDGMSFLLSNSQAYEVVCGLGNVQNKHVPQWIKDSSPDIIQAFLDEVVLGDGHTTKNQHQSYYTISRRLAGDMQELYLKCGYGVAWHTREPQPVSIVGREGHGNHVLYTVNRAVRKWAGLRDKNRNPNFKTVYYNGMVYCATVLNGTLIVRRNGKVSICGNCFQRQKMIRWRTWYYRQVACDLSRQYSNVAVGEIDWHEIAESKPVEEDDDINRTYRGIAAGATLKENLTERMNVVEVDPEWIARECHHCGTRCPDPGRGRYITCERCGNVKRDRAENAAKNILRRIFGAAVTTTPSRGT